MPYALGAVKPHVKQAAEQLGARFGVSTIYGWAPGQYDHPKGLALDLMVDNDRAKGDAIAAYSVANAGALGLTYVIWYNRIWSVARSSEGWRPYTTTSRTGDWQHVRHVHLSFSPSPGNGMQLLETTNVGNPLVPNGVENLVEVFKDLDAMIGRLSRKELWYRIALFVAGFWMCAFALLKIVGADQKAAQAAQMFIGSKVKKATGGKTVEGGGQ